MNRLIVLTLAIVAVAAYGAGAGTGGTSAFAASPYDGTWAASFTGTLDGHSAYYPATPCCAGPILMVVTSPGGKAYADPANSGSSAGYGLSASIASSGDAAMRIEGLKASDASYSSGFGLYCSFEAHFATSGTADSVGTVSCGDSKPGDASFTGTFHAVRTSAPPVALPPTKPKPTTVYPTSVSVIAIVRGRGRIAGGAVNCPGKCKFALTKTVRKVTLRAIPAPGYRFAGWGGNCPGKLWGLTPCTLTVGVDGGDIISWAGEVGGYANPSQPNPTRAIATFLKSS